MRVRDRGLVLGWRRRRRVAAIAGAAQAHSRPAAMIAAEALELCARSAPRPCGPHPPATRVRGRRPCSPRPRARPRRTWRAGRCCSGSSSSATNSRASAASTACFRQLRRDRPSPSRRAASSSSGSARAKPARTVSWRPSAACLVRVSAASQNTRSEIGGRSAPAGRGRSAANSIASSTTSSRTSGAAGARAGSAPANGARTHRADARAPAPAAHGPSPCPTGGSLTQPLPTRRRSRAARSESRQGARAARPPPGAHRPAGSRETARIGEIAARSRARSSRRTSTRRAIPRDPRRDWSPCVPARARTARARARSPPGRRSSHGAAQPAAAARRRRAPRRPAHARARSAAVRCPDAVIRSLHPSRPAREQTNCTTRRSVMLPIAPRPSELAPHGRHADLAYSLRAPAAQAAQGAPMPPASARPLPRALDLLVHIAPSICSEVPSSRVRPPPRLQLARRRSPDRRVGPHGVYRPPAPTSGRSDGPGSCGLGGRGRVRARARACSST